MDLHYLTFDFSDEDCGRGSFDAMACVAPPRLHAVLEEVRSVLEWAEAAFGPAGDETGWDHDVQVVPEPDGRTTVAFAISGSAAFCDALRNAFPQEGT